jgi:hypothetical protein
VAWFLQGAAMTLDEGRIASHAIFAVLFMMWLGFVLGVGYAVLHFIVKFW